MADPHGTAVPAAKTTRDPDLSELAAIIRERYETGAHGDVFLRVAPDTWEAIRTATPPRPTKPMWAPIDVDALLQIPIVVDEDGEVPSMAWQLVTFVSKEIRRSGSVSDAR